MTRFPSRLRSNDLSSKQEEDVDEDTIREHAAKHGKATVAGDFKTAGRDLAPEAVEQAPGVMKVMPKTLSDADIASVEKDGDAYIAVIDYSGGGESTKVASRWEEREGRPRIVDLKVL
jgi:hypothetical protein